VAPSSAIGAAHVPPSRQSLDVRVGLDDEAQTQPALLDLTPIRGHLIGAGAHEHGLVRFGILDQVREVVLDAHLVHADDRDR